MSVRTCARAAAARLDSEQIVEERHDEVVVQVSAGRTAYDERDDRQTFRVDVAEDLDRRLGRPRVDGATQQRFLRRADDRDPDRLLELKDQAGADRADDVGGATLLPRDRVVEVDV